MARPIVRFPDALPISAHVDELRSAIDGHPVVIVCGETGSGKSTQMPKICLSMGRGSLGWIGHTMPRRIAARSVARRIAEEIGSPRHVGHAVRFDDTVGPDTLVKVMTDGILLAETRRDRQLRRYDTLIIDEAHERSLNIDFLLGYLARLVRKRRDLKVIVTSATIDPDRFSAFFDGAPVIEVSGRTYPVEIRYRPIEAGAAAERDRAGQAAIADAVDELRDEGPGDVLVFLSGEREIRETARTLRGRRPEAEIFPLYARLSAAEQTRVFRPHRGRRIVLATNVAETSLTVPGIRYVIDPGFARISRYSARRRLQRLPVERISQASADQRAGRCGRVQDGICIRLYGEEDLQRRPRFTAPEIMRTNLASVILQMKSLGLGTIASYPWLDPPKPAAIREGERTLHELGALDDHGALTEVGRRLGRLPVDPRLGRMIIASGDEQCLSEVLIIASALAIQDPRERPLDEREKADAAHRVFSHEHSDFLAFVNMWNAFHEQRWTLSSGRLRAWCRERYLSFVRMREWHDVHRQLKLLSSEVRLSLNRDAASDDAVHRAVLTGLLGNVARHEERGEYRGGQGGDVRIFPGSVLARATPRWIVAAEIVETSRRFARTVARVRPEWIESLAPHLVRRSHADPFWDSRSSRVMAFERVTIFGLELVARRRVPYGAIDPAGARDVFIREALVAGRLGDPPPFLVHNLGLAEQIDALEAKTRRRDLLVDEETRFAFYGSRLPADVCDGRSLARWRRDAGRESPDSLLMTRDDLIDAGAGDVSPERYPDALPVGNLTLPLQYRYEPGHPEDGVTVTVPRAALASVPAETLDWLVPGLIEEKIVAMLRALPKPVRRQLVPIPDTARACTGRLTPRGPLAAALSACLLETRGVEVPQSDWDRELPEHLRMNVRVVDESGETLAEGRDLSSLRRRLGAKATSEVSTDDTAVLERDGADDWEFGTLPETVTVEAGAGLALDGHPAVVDQSEAVGVRVLTSAPRALAAHRAGVVRLIALREADQLDAVIDHLPGLDGMTRFFAPLGTGSELVDALRRIIVARAYVDGQAEVRTREAFDARLDAGREHLWETALEVGSLVERILETQHEAARRLDEAPPAAWRDAVAAMRAHLSHLVRPGFLTDTPAPWLSQLPRYLAAIVRRHEKLAGGGHVRDARAQAEIGPLREACAERWRLDEAEGRFDPELEHYRWMLEEYAVSLFAQELGTSIPVSSKRLAKQWDRIGR